MAALIELIGNSARLIHNEVELRVPKQCFYFFLGDFFRTTGWSQS